MTEITEKFCYDLMIERLEQGLVPSCVPVRYQGMDAVYTSVGAIDMNIINDDEDILALVIVAIERAYTEALAVGATIRS